MVDFFSSMVSVFVRATSCISCSESQVCAEQHGSPCSTLWKGLFVRLYRDKSAQWVVTYFFQLILNSVLPQLIFVVTMSLLVLWLRDRLGLTLLVREKYLQGNSSWTDASPARVTLAHFVQASFALQRAFLFNTASPHGFLDRVDFPSHNSAN